jgi:predicted Zn finger-like uncharacterized protein
MNLATRCPQCGTVFRVAEDQLLSSEGWVRCGRCNGVFDATEVLFDIDTNAPMRLAMMDEPAAARGTPVAATAPAAPDPADALPDDAPFESLLRAPSRADEATIDEPIVITDHIPPAPPPTPAWASAPADEPRLLADEPALASAVAESAAPSGAGQAAEPALMGTPSWAAADPAPVAQVRAEPSFLRQAERGRQLHHPVARAAMWLVILLLALAVPLQMALLWRDTLAAHLPQTEPTLQSLCRLAGCSVQPLRRIQQLGVGSSGLNRLEGSPLYQLHMVLHNRADTAVMMPAVDLTLTDAQGQLVARRVLPAADMGVVQTALQSGQELPIKLLLATGERPVAGYTLELFYP